jgi:uncharacterized protein (TIGR00661 family)
MIKKVIVAPLNWGLGHASRCVPIINSLIQNKFTPVLASDGQALLFLQKEFPELEYIELPSYNIGYAKNLKWSLVLQTPKIVKAVKKERQIIAKYIQNNGLNGIISDNRFGVRSKHIPSVYITHQVNISSGVSTSVTSKIHQKIIKKFDECWIPDVKEQPNLSGELSKISDKSISARFIGVLSRFKKENLHKENDVLIIISGPEPNRSQLEEKLLSEFKNLKGNVVLVQGKVEEQQTKARINNITLYNYMLSYQLQDQINKSELIVCRSGYSTIMDLAKLSKRAFFIPTKNQPEQEYLAKYLEEKKMAPYATQEEFKAELLKRIKNYNGLNTKTIALDSGLFDLFKSKRKS